MAITLNGDTGITTPAETIQGNLTTTGNTILGDASTDTLNVGNGGLIKDASGNVGVGVTPSAWGSSYKALAIGANNYVSIANDSGSYGKVSIANFAYAATNPASISDTTNWKYTWSGLPAALYQQDNGKHVWYNAPSGTSGNAITFTQAMTLDANGALLIGATSVYSGGEKLLVANNAGDWTSIFRATTATAGNAYGILVDYTSSPNGTSNWFYRGTVTGGTVVRFEARSNGGIANFSANNVNLSDERTKKDIIDAGNYLDKICAIPVRTFLYKDQTDTQLNLGVIAQEVEAVAPELVDVSGFGETPEDGVPLKAIYQTDLQYALMKCIQEQQAMIDELKAKVAALEAA
jgi:hypothetical protein